MTIRALILLLLTAVPAAATSPIAEIICAPRAEMIQRLQVEYGAARQGIGLDGPERMMEIWAAERSGDWTLVLTYADGKSCIVAMGEDWEAVAPDRG